MELGTKDVVPGHLLTNHSVELILQISRDMFVKAPFIYPGLLNRTWDGLLSLILVLSCLAYLLAAMLYVQHTIIYNIYAPHNLVSHKCSRILTRIVWQLFNDYMLGCCK